MRKTQYRVLTPLLAALAVLHWSVVAAQTSEPANETPELKGLRIMQEAKNRDAGWKDMQSTITMILIDQRGRTNERQLRSTALEVDDDGDKALVVFDSPRDVAGTAFLSHSHSLAPDDQWLYLPALRRDRRISSSNKSGPFVSSEFAFEDMTSPEIEKYSYKWLRDETLDGRDHFVVEQIPQYDGSGYSKLVTWVDKERYTPARTEFYNQRDEHFKTLTYLNYKQYLDKWWRPDETLMVNHDSGKSTRMLLQDIQFMTGLSEDDFTVNALRRAR